MPSPRRRRWVVGLVIAGIAISAGWSINRVFTEYRKWRDQRDIHREYAELRADGIPTTPEELESSYILPPGVEDCTQLWLDAAADLSTTGSEFADSGFPLISRDDPDFPPLPGEEWPALDDVDALLKKHHHTLNHLHEAARRGGAARLPTDFAAGMDADLSYLAGLRSAVRILLLECYLRAHHGEIAGAVESLLAARAVAHGLDRKPDLVSSLVRISLDTKCNQALLRLLPSLELDDRQLEAIQSDCQSLEFREQFRNDLRGDRVKVIVSLEKEFQSEGSIAVPMLWTPVGASMQAGFLRMMKRAESAAALPMPDCLNALAELEADLETDRQAGGGDRNTMVLLLLPALRAAATAVARAEAQRDCTVVLIAARRYHLRNGSWPDSPVELTPDLLPSAPNDPFDGQPLRFMRNESDLIAYSVGENGRDDAGLDDAEQGDLVFRLAWPK
jgi:hypothetical protein